MALASSLILGSDSAMTACVRPSFDNKGSMSHGLLLKFEPASLMHTPGNKLDLGCVKKYACLQTAPGHLAKLPRNRGKVNLPCTRISCNKYAPALKTLLVP